MKTAIRLNNVAIAPEHQTPKSFQAAPQPSIPTGYPDKSTFIQSQLPANPHLSTYIHLKNVQEYPRTIAFPIGTQFHASANCPSSGLLLKSGVGIPLA